jgi:hypothetical protein
VAQVGCRAAFWQQGICITRLAEGWKLRLRKAKRSIEAILVATSSVLYPKNFNGKTTLQTTGYPWQANGNLPPQPLIDLSLPVPLR